MAIGSEMGGRGGSGRGGSGTVEDGGVYGVSSSSLRRAGGATVWWFGRRCLVGWVVMGMGDGRWVIQRFAAEGTSFVCVQFEEE